MTKGRTHILRSSYEAMQVPCPKGHAEAGRPCEHNAAIVCPERRAMVNIYSPGQYVKVDQNWRLVK